MPAVDRAVPRAARDRVLPFAARGLLALPTPVHRALAGPPPPHAAGLAPDAWLVARLAERESVPPGALPVDRARERFAMVLRPLGVRPRLPLAAEDRTVAGAAGPLHARLYVPDGAETPGPLLVYYHGGGWVEGSVATHEPSCRLLAHLAGVRVLSVDYRLAPEHPFPAAVDDALAAFRDARARAPELGADPARVAVGGDSAGGNLAAVTALALRGEPDAPAFQLLIYPGVDMTRKRPSRLRFGEGFVLTEENMTFYEDQYVPDRARRSDPRVSPMLAPDIAGVAPAHVATGLADPLRDDGEEYAARLRAAGVPVALYRHPQIHGFFNITAMRSGLRGLTLIAGALRQGLG
jgi:acetyl esterase